MCNDYCAKFYTASKRDLDRINRAYSSEGKVGCLALQRDNLEDQFSKLIETLFNVLVGQRKQTIIITENRDLIIRTIKKMLSDKPKVSVNDTRLLNIFSTSEEIDFYSNTALKFSIHGTDNNLLIFDTSAIKDSRITCISYPKDRYSIDYYVHYCEHLIYFPLPSEGESNVANELDVRELIEWAFKNGMPDATIYDITC